jgi:Ca2+:H+ antiporter
LSDLVAAARAHAARLGHDYIGSEHLFLALLDSGDGHLGAILKGFDLDPAAVRERVERRVPKGRGASPENGDTALRSGARRALEAARADAAAEGAPEMAPRHLLQALLRDGKGPAVTSLQELGVPVEKVREALRTVSPARPSKPAAGEASERRQKAPREERKPRERPRRAADAPEEPGSRPPQSPPRLPPVGNSRLTLRNALLLALPASMAAAYLHAPASVVFTLSGIGVLPLAGYMGEATEHLAARTGPTAGGFLNATFGNAAELIIAVAALRAGLIDLVKASITGSILGNLLLILGLSLMAPGFNKPLVRFNRTAVGMSSGMLALAVTGLVFPAIFHAIHPDGPADREQRLSEAVAVILIFTYILSLLFSLKTHKRLFSGEPHPTSGRVWSVGFSVLVLALATIGVAVESEILVHATKEITAQYSFVSETFLGLIVIPLIGNAAEHASAVVVARKGHTDLALNIALGSSTQVALLVAPLLVFVGLGFGPSAATGSQMNLLFHPFEVVAVFLATLLSAIITLDGESHWFEGVQLLALYAMIAVTVLFI